MLLKVFILQGTMAEWLTREIRNLFLSEGAGSNPAGVVTSLDHRPSLFLGLVSVGRRLLNERSDRVDARNQ